jgi:hypothetical protein
MIKTPLVSGLMICEQVIIEATTNNVSLINCFTTRRFREFPTIPHQMAVVAQLADGVGQNLLELVLADLTSGDELDRISRQINFTDSLQKARAVFRFNELVFRHPGRYEVTLVSNREWLAQQTFSILEQEKSE